MANPVFVSRARGEQAAATPALAPCNLLPGLFDPTVTRHLPGANQPRHTASMVPLKKFPARKPARGCLSRMLCCNVSSFVKGNSGMACLLLQRQLNRDGLSIPSPQRLPSPGLEWIRRSSLAGTTLPHLPRLTEP